MLLLALMLSGPMPAIDADQHRVRRVRRASAKITLPARARPGNGAALCGAACERDASQRYRLPLPSPAIVDAKREAVRDTGLACGVTGAPVCPQRGRQVLKASLAD